MGRVRIVVHLPPEHAARLSGKAGKTVAQCEQD
jgi:hypothetical protein